MYSNKIYGKNENNDNNDIDFSIKLLTHNGIKILDEKSAFFLRPQLFLKSRTNSNQQLIDCLVYHEITQISERSL